MGLTHMVKGDYEKMWPVAVVDEEMPGGYVVTRCKDVAEAEWYLGYLAEHGGSATRAKIERGGYGIDAPEGM